MIQRRLGSKPKVRYNYGPYNKVDDKEQWIRISEGCPHNCPYCYEPQKKKIFRIPKIVRNDVKIMDMNLLCKEKVALKIIEELGKIRVNDKIVEYQLICGIDYRFLTQEIANALKKNRFKQIRIAWDWNMDQQYKIKDAIQLLKREGYNSKDLMIFMICNWRIKYEECCNKLDLCKIWKVKIADCYYDNQVFPNVIPLHWTDEQNKTFRKKCRKHNHLVNFEIDPEVKERK